MDAIRERVLNSGIARAEEIVGCAPEEVAGIEAQLGVQLPAAYRAFLLGLGRRAGSLFQGEDVEYPLVLDFRAQAERILDEDAGLCGRRRFSLPQDAFVFWTHQNYLFYYFPTADYSDDPAVYRFMQEEDGQPRRESDSFLSFLSDWVDVVAEVNRRVTVMRRARQSAGEAGRRSDSREAWRRQRRRR